ETLTRPARSALRGCVSFGCGWRLAWLGLGQGLINFVERRLDILGPGEPLPVHHAQLFMDGRHELFYWFSLALNGRYPDAAKFSFQQHKRVITVLVEVGVAAALV